MKSEADSKSLRAGRSDKFPSGTVTYLSPLPLPTGLPAVDHSQIVAEVRDEYLELGAFTPNVFAWQVTVGIPTGVLLLMSMVLPMLMFVGGFVHGEGWYDAIELFILFFIVGLKYGGGSLCLACW
jgi:hypothetical protein